MQEPGAVVAPSARTVDVLIQPLSDEVLVYDLQRDRAHCLNPMAAQVWQQCDGQTSVAIMAQRLAPVGQPALPLDVVWLALEQLSKAHLLTERFPPATAQHRVSRRDALRTVGKAAGLVLPIVTSLVVPTVSEAASCLGTGQACTSSAQCCSGFCVSSACL